MATVGSFAVPDPSTICLWFIARGYNASVNYLMGSELLWCSRLNTVTVKIEAGYNQNPSTSTDSTSTLGGTGIRVHVAFVNERSITGNLYWNGVLENSNSGSSTPTSPNTLAVGGRNGSTDYANGDLEDVRIYNRILQAGEINCIYHSGGRDNIVRGLINRWATNSKGNGTDISTDNIYDETASRQHLSKLGAGGIYYRGGFLNPRRRV